MSIQLEVSQVVDRPVQVVFHFYADEHVRNHPRWDPDIELQKAVEGPLRLGSKILRRNKRSGTPVEGTMEVVEFELDRAFGLLIHDGAVEMRGRATFEALDEGRTRVTVSAEMPGMDESSANTTFLKSRMQRSVDTMKQLIESEL